MSGINTKPTDKAELYATLEGVKAALDDIRANPADISKHEAFVKAAADIETAVVHLKKVEKDAATALELAQDAARSPLGKTDTRALGKLPLLYTPEGDVAAMFANDGNITKDHIAHFNVLNYCKDDLAGVDEHAVKRVERLRYLNARLTTMDAIMLGQRNLARVQDYIKRGRFTSLPLYPEFLALSREFRAAMDTAESGAGADWVPTGVNSTLIGDIRPEHLTPSMFPQYIGSRSPQNFPVQGASFRGYVLAEPTSDTEASNTAMGARDTATASVTFTAVKIGAITYYSREVDQDSLIQLATVINADHQYANGESLESWIWNGQLGTNGMGGSAAASSSFDTGETFGTGSSRDDRSAGDGIRLLYSNGGCTTAGDAGSGLIADLFTDQFGQMGRFAFSPAECFVGTGFVGAAKLLVMKDSAGHNVTLTAEKAGGQGTFDTGVLYRAFGRDVVVSPQYPQNLNASGVADGSGTKTAYHIVCKRRFGMFRVQLVQIEASGHFRFNTDQVSVRSTWRGQFKPVVTPSSTEKSIGAILNV